MVVLDSERVRLAASLLRLDGFERWEVLRHTFPDPTYETFRRVMTREFCPASIHTAREIAFFTTTYDPAMTVPDVVRQFRREMIHCQHLVTGEETLIQLLSMRLPPALVMQLSTHFFTTLLAYTQAALTYDEARGRSEAVAAYAQEGKRHRTYSTPSESSTTLISPSYPHPSPRGPAPISSRGGYLQYGQSRGQ